MRTSKIKSLKSSTLFITVVLTLIIGILCSLLILLSYNNLQNEINVHTENKLARNLQSAINRVLTDSSVIAEQRIDSTDLFGGDDDPCIIKTENWGLFSIASVEVKANKKRKEKNFFFGQAANQYFKTCLFLTEHQTSLSLSGHALLDGDAYLPKGGLKPAYIDQRGFAFTELIKGEIRSSPDSLPSVDAHIIENIGSLLNSARRDTAGEIANDIVSDQVTRSFADSPVIIRAKGVLTLSLCSLTGHVLVLSDSMIRVSSDSRLENIVLAAPVIEFENGFSGTVQAFSSDSIIVRNNCHFSYPSTLTILKSRVSESQPRIVIGDSCALEGSVVTITPAKDLNKTYAEFGSNTVIKGFAYISGYLYLKGKVYGTVLTDYFILRSPPNVFINYLLDAEINRNSLSAYFIGPHIFSGNEQNKIVQWVN